MAAGARSGHLPRYQTGGALEAQRRQEEMIAILLNSCTDYHLLGLDLELRVVVRLGRKTWIRLGARRRGRLRSRVRGAQRAWQLARVGLARPPDGGLAWLRLG